MAQKAQKGVGESRWVVGFGTRMKRIEKTKTDFFYHKRHKRVWVEVDGLSLLEHGFEKFEKSKKKYNKRHKRVLVNVDGL